MRVPIVQTNKPQPSFGVFKGCRETPYGNYMWGVLKGKKIEVFDAYKCNEKLIYVSESDTLRWVKSKFTYMQDGVKKVVNCSAKHHEFYV